MKIQKLNFSSILKIKTSKFILTVGDEGAILILVKEGKLDVRLFATLTAQDEIEKFKELLATEPDIPISILVDVSDQTYSRQTFPGINSYTLKKLVQKKLSRDLASVELKNSINIGRSKNGRNEWNVIFVGCPIVTPLKEWLNFVAEQSNPIGEICMLPIEVASLVSKINSLNFDNPTEDSKKAPNEISKWQLILTHNKVGGFRQVAFYENKVIFSRLIAIQSDESAHYIAGNIEQELLNTIEYLKRLSLRESDGFDLIIIVSQDIKNSLQKVKFTARNILIMTPYETAYKIGLKNAAVESDKYADIITSVNFATNKSVLTFADESLKKIKFFEISSKISKLLFFTIIIVCIILTLINSFQIYSNNKNSEVKNKELSKLQENFTEIKNKLGNLEEVEKISNIVALYKILTNNNISPFEIIKKFSDIKDTNLLIKSINWKAKDPIKQDDNKAIKNDNYLQSAVTFSCEFYNEKMGYQELFESFDKFIKVIENSFKDYTIEYSRNTEKISFDNSIKKIPLQITITGPNLKNDKGNPSA
ncbi:MAG: hypothetical protein ACK4OM_05205 [Alphaproteobacteria bacterium]